MRIFQILIKLKYISIFALLTIFTMTPLMPQAQAKEILMTNQLPLPVAQQIKAINDNKESTWLNLFTSDAIVNDWGRVFQGHQEIKAWSDKEFIGAHGQLTVIKAQTKGNQVTVDANWRSHFYTGKSRFIFIVDGKKIREMRITSLK